MDAFDRPALSRRRYLWSLVAAGGLSGLSACLDATGEPSVPTGDTETLPVRQHAWNAFLETDDSGNHVPPEHHVLVALRLTATPDRAVREQVETAFQSLEAAYAWKSEGLLFTVGYTPNYFHRIGSAPISEPDALTSMESPAFDEYDALVHLASDHPSVVLEAEEALFGEIRSPNGVEMEATLEGVFEPAAPRRTGFVAPGLPATHTNLEGVPDAVPDEAPFFMGFRSGFAESQAPEDRVTIRDGPFEGGTTMHVSTLDLQLKTWFEQDSHYQRVAKMFSPEHADEDAVGEIGETLGDATGVAGEVTDSTAEDARRRGMVGHAQKAARARDDDGTPPLLRRDFNTVDGETPGVHFVSCQRAIDEFVRVRDAMTGADLAGSGVGQRLNNGILQYIFVQRRGNYLLPPRPKRALPTTE